jgi:hypothetical protein
MFNPKTLSTCFSATRWKSISILKLTVKDGGLNLGATSQGRILVVVITMRGDKIRVVTAYDATQRDKQLYLTTKAGEQ